MFPGRLFILLFPAAMVLAAPPADQMSRGEQIFVAKCALCHQINGVGVPPVYPPLAESDWIKVNRSRTIRVLCEGLEGEITVKGLRYANVMPAQVLDDHEVADVLTYVSNSWGNTAAPYTGDEVKAARAESKFKTYAELLKATEFSPLPKAPQGWQVREVAQLPEFCTRLATRGNGAPVYVLAQRGTVFVIDAASKAVQPIIPATDYLDHEADRTALGLTVSPDGQLYIVTDERVTRDVELVQNEVIIWRSSATENGHPTKPKKWLKVRYPFGVGPYNHGVSCIEFGPDGMLYVNSGSRTDGGEAGLDPKYFKGGETDLTAALWRLNPRDDNPQVEIFARGIRNAWGLAWDGEGRMFSVTNGPDANSPEELDVVEKGKHYGFPYQFSNWPVRPNFPYPHTPPPPEGVAFTMPVLNLGPAGGGTADQPIGTYDAHSSPGGMIWCGDDWPEPLRHSFLVTRFGNLLGAPAAPVDVGFDVLSSKIERRTDGTWIARTTTVLAEMGRPLDVVKVGAAKAYILEYTRPTNFRDKLGWLPGRVVELSDDSR